MASKTQRTRPNEPASSWLDKADVYARTQPTRAVVTAAGAGFIINLLPIGAIVGLLAAVAFALVRPALLFLGLLKAGEFLSTKSTSKTDL